MILFILLLAVILGRRGDLIYIYIFIKTVMQGTDLIYIVLDSDAG